MVVECAYGQLKGRRRILLPLCLMLNYPTSTKERPIQIFHSLKTEITFIIFCKVNMAACWS